MQQLLLMPNFCGGLRKCQKMPPKCIKLLWETMNYPFCYLTEKNVIYFLAISDTKNMLPTDGLIMNIFLHLLKVLSTLVSSDFNKLDCMNRYNKSFTVQEKKMQFLTSLKWVQKYGLAMDLNPNIVLFCVIHKSASKSTFWYHF